MTRTSASWFFDRMENVVDRALVDQLLSELSSYGISLEREKAEVLVSYLELVIEKNKTLNLTRITNPEEAVTLHLVDSLLPLACKELTVTFASTLLDMGTGAGFPGVPLAVTTGAQSLLVDSVGKKVAAVAEFVGKLGIGNVRTEHGRLEDIARELPGTQDVVIARAVAQTKVLIEYATPFLSTNGMLVVEKGRPEELELQEAEKTAEVCGLKFVSRETFELSHSLGHREILFYQRVRNSNVKLPRQAGMAKKQPLVGE